MVDFAANAISFLTNVDPDYISNILNGTENSPFTPPLDCITKNLIAMRNKTSTLKKSFIQQLKILAVPSPGILTELQIKKISFIMFFQLCFQSIQVHVQLRIQI